MGTARERSWYISITSNPPGRWTARFGHRKAGAGWVWDEVTWSEVEEPMTEHKVLAELYAACCEFMERQA